MTNLQLWLAVALPIVAVLSSLVISMFQISGVREDMREMRRAMDHGFEMMAGRANDLSDRMARVEERLAR